MVIDPRPVEPGYELRWMKGTLFLLWRSAAVWSLLAMLFAIVDHFGAPVLGPTACLLAIPQSLIIIYLAALSTEKQVTVQDLAESFQQVIAPTREWLAANWFVPPALLVLRMSYSLIEPLFAHLLPRPAAFFHADSILSWMFSIDSPLHSGAVISAGGWFLYGLHGFSSEPFVPFLLQAFRLLLGMHDAVHRFELAARAAHRNPAPLLFAILAVVSGSMIGSFIPVFGVLWAVIGPMFGFVVFRDMFIDSADNRNLETPGRSPPVTVPRAAGRLGLTGDHSVQ